MTPDDDKISAWIDGGLDNEGAQAMHELADAHEQIAQRAARFRKIDTLVRDAVPLEDDVPHELLERLGLAGAASRGDNVVSLAQVRAAKAAPAQSAPSRWAALTSGRLAAQWLLVAGLAVGGALFVSTMRNDRDDAPYHALGDGPASTTPAANAILMLAPDADQAAVRARLQAAGVRVLGAPTASGAWKLAVPLGNRDVLLEGLRSTPGVTMAEPLDAGQGQ